VRRPPAEAVRLREGLDKSAVRVALANPTIHSPRRCGTSPAPKAFRLSA